MSHGPELDEAAFAYEHFGQEGEDALLQRTFDSRTSGFYVDVGAHHPFRFSNTYTFYKRGWQGINIEANPDALRLFETHRPRDINVQALVAEEEGVEHDYALFEEAALNTAVPFARDNLLRLGVPVERTIHLNARRLDSILEEHLPAGTDITFMSVDVEGLDLQVLRSNDWRLYRPEIVLAETGVDLMRPQDNLIVSYMMEQGYRFRAYLHLTAVFERNPAG
jgi:FkbM family methyltransferase